MKKSVLGIVVVSLVIGTVVCSALCVRSGKDGGEGDFAIYVSPNTISPDAPCISVTVHAEVAYALADAVYATVDGIEVEVLNTFADSRGMLVAKMSFDDVLEIAASPSATVTLTVVTGADSMEASGTVNVKD